MKIMIETDMEGCAGILNFKDWVYPDGKYYDLGRRFTTEEVNAAIRGFFDAGADEIYVSDGHGYGGLDISLLDERVKYLRGVADPLDDTFDAIAWVGQHAKAGTVGSHMPHTGTPAVFENTVNGVSVGEFGEGCIKAGEYGIPAIFLAGELAMTKEAEALIPGIHTVAVKEGTTRDNGADLNAVNYETHNLGAIHLTPAEANRRVYDGAKAALEDFIKEPGKIKPFTVGKPYIMKTWYRDQTYDRPYVHIRRHPDSFVKCLRDPGDRIHYDANERPYEPLSLD